ncbi:MAG: hypothetical protein D6718_03990 [Acidobacteria bacterium]|nr:MAG: hypothetical protein D6718_03990 [Acidobacteriota bacterium]
MTAIGLVAALALPAAPQQPPPAPPPVVRRKPPERFVALELLSAIPSRLGEELGEPDVVVRVPASDSDAALERQAAGWLEELFAPLNSPSCRPVARAAGLPDPGGMARKLARLWPAGRPIAAAPGGEPVLIRRTYPPPSATDLEMLRTTGILPVELALAGEWARAVGARHAGPPPADPLLRHARAARLEGVARVAGILVALASAGLDASAVGQALLDADRDRAGWVKDRLYAGTDQPVYRAMLRVLLEDGPRWAAYHAVRAGTAGLVAALERPGIGPHVLLRPGLPPPRSEAPDGACRLGPRPTVALVGLPDDSPWVGALRDEWIEVSGTGSLEAVLAFDGEASATRAAADLSARGCRATAAGRRVTASCRP